MKVTQELLPGVFVIEYPNFEDRRGSLGIPFNATEFEGATGRPFVVSQTMHSVSKKNVLRGLHYQDATAPVAKLISCHRGKIYDVIVDLRDRSQSFGCWVAIELSGDDFRQIYAPPGTAHGYLSLTEGSEVFYYQDGEYNPGAACILRWDDPYLKEICLCGIVGVLTLVPQYFER
jgi:dTDP-4-dehydrorhamnose 3,5-epimerase